MSFTPSRRVSAVLTVLLAGTALVAPSVNPGAAAARSSVVVTRGGSNPPTPGNFTGKAFDQCSAPSQRAMNAWRHSPYRGVGVYISGSVRACKKQRNLTAGWVRTQLTHGWKLLPIHVGRQAACNTHPHLRHHRISANPARGYARARAQARGEAYAAIAAARRLGLPRHSTIFYDLEGFRVSSSTCRNSSLHFLSAWSQRLQASGYVSGVYASGSSGIRILDQARARGTQLSLPQQVWVADWNGYANTRSSHLRSGGWIKSRVKQYRGDHTERHGGVRINIDSNFVDLSIAQVQSSSHRAARHTTKHAAKHTAKHHAKHKTRHHARHKTRHHAKHRSRHNRWSYLPGGSTPEVERPVTDRLCTTHRINLATYPSTGVFRRTRLHARLQCVLKQNGLFEHRVDGYWGRRMAHGVHRLQARADRLVRSTMTRGDWVALLVSGHHRSWLVRGVRGADVVRLQRALHAAGVRGVYISGRYDRATARAVRTYQHRVGIRATGTVGMKTWRYLGRGRY